MSFEYDGVYNAAQAPSSAPGLDVDPAATMPSSGDALTVASVAQRIKVAMDGLAYTWRTGAGGYLAAILARANTWVGIQGFANRAIFSGNLAGVQSDITPSADFDVIGLGKYKLIMRATDTDNPNVAKPLVYIAGNGAALGSPGSFVDVVNGTWNGTTWRCIDTTAPAVVRIIGVDGLQAGAHAATAGTWADNAWTRLQSQDATTREIDFFGDLVSSGGAIFAGNAQAQDVKATRFLSGGRLFGAGNPVIAGNFFLSSDWGSTATVAVTGTDLAGSVTITPGGIGLNVNPVVTFTFRDGAFGSVPSVVSSHRVAGPYVPMPIGVIPSTTTVQFVPQSFTPTGGAPFTLYWQTTGI